MAYDDFLIDKRVVERNIKKGLVEEQTFRQQIESLPDRESNCVHVSLEGGVQAASDTDAQLEEQGADEPQRDEEPEDDEDEDDEDEDEASEEPGLDESAPETLG